MKIIKYFLLLILPIFCGSNLADPLDVFIQSLEEQSALTSWVKDNATGNLTKGDTDAIIKEVYTQSISKNINPHLVLAIIKSESSFNKKARSHEGAVGLMQVIPKWHKDKLNRRDPTNIKVSIEVGTQILFDCMDKHKKNILKSLNCYSGGGGKKYANRISNYKKDITMFVVNSNHSNASILAGNF